MRLREIDPENRAVRNTGWYVVIKIDENGKEVILALCDSNNVATLLMSAIGRTTTKCVLMDVVSS